MQSPPAAPPVNAAPAGNSRHDAHLETVKRERTAVKEKLRAAEARIAELEGAKDAEAFAKVQEENETLRQQLQANADAQAARERAEARKTNQDALLEGARPDKRDELGLLVDGMAARGEIDLDSTDPSKAAASREALAKKWPQYYGGEGGGVQPGIPQGQGVDLSGVDFHLMTPEQRANLSDEEFESLSTGPDFGDEKSGPYL